MLIAQKNLFGEWNIECIGYQVGTDGVPAEEEETTVVDTKTPSLF